MAKKNQPKQQQDQFWGQAVAQTEKKRRRGWPLFLSLAFLGILTFAIFAVTGYLVAGKVANNRLSQENQEGIAEAAPAGPETVLIIGVDKQDPREPARSDTIMLTVLDPSEHKVDILSIPRDSRVKIPGRNYDKINAAYAYGGIQLLLDTINDLLGSQVDNYVELDFQGFENIINILGGVEIEVDKRMYHPEERIDIQPGLQLLNGHDALGFVRYRKDDPGADITRIGRQQKFIKALAAQTLRLSTIPKIPRLVNEISRNMETNLGIKEMLNLALGMKDLDSGAINTYMLPGEGHYINDISYWIIDHQELAELMLEFPDL